MVPTLTPAFIIPEGIGGGISGGGQNVALTAAGVVAAGVIAGGLIVVAAPVVAAVAAKASLLTAASPLGLLAVGAFLKGREQLREWGLLNFRPAETAQEITEPTYFALSDGVDVNFIIKYDQGGSQGPSVGCNPPYYTGTGYPFSGGPLSISQFGVGLTIGPATWTQTFVCGGSGYSETDAAPYITLHRANGGVFVLANTPGSIIYYAASDSRVLTNTRKNLRVERNGVDTPLTISNAGTFAPGTRPQLFPQTLPDAPPLPAPPLREPLETPVLPPPPDRRPLAPPVTIPRPGQDPARVPVPGPRPGPAPSPGPSPTPSQPAPAGVPAVGPLPLPIPLPVPTTPGSVVIVDGQPISGPGQAPAPNLVAMAQELGRIERKQELMLERPANGGAGGLGSDAAFAALRALAERLLEALINQRPAGSYELWPSCPVANGEDPLEPVIVEWTASGGPLVDLAKRVDALAMLIQAHKDMGQPSCRSAISGRPVTVNFISDP